MIWFTSDTHYHHRNICRGTSQWENAGTPEDTFTRHYNSLEEMDAAIVNNINEVVKPEDTLYHLGDWSLGGKDQILAFRKRLKCKNIHLVLGNHDDSIRYNKKVWSKRPISDEDEISVQECFSSVQDLLELRNHEWQIILCHYPMRVWHDCHKGAIMLHGHSHGNLMQLNHKSMDVGMDTHPEFRPYSLDEILEEMGSKPANLIESHRGLN